IRESGSYLLDTNIVVAFLNGSLDLAPRRRDGALLFVNANVIGELLFGFEKSTRREKNLEALSQLMTYCVALPCTATTAPHYARVRHRLTLRGKPIPENDIWIAASAFEHDLELVTRDSHFEQVDDLRRAAW
ncbi:MAG: type II toxin-antitoxin system VapC family toxin, partial [Candidatus Binatia bacterium]